MSDPVQRRWIDIGPGYAGYLALPPAGRGPGILLMQEIFGVNEHIRAVADQYALDGFVVLAPDLFWRQAPRVELGYEGADITQGRALMTAYTAEQAIADIGAAARTLRARAEVGTSKVGGSGEARIGALGYCMGGRMAWFAAATAGVDAAVPYYGGGIHLHLHHAATVRCPVQFHFAGHDDHIPPEAVAAVRQAMGPDRAEMHVYADAHHGFNCWARGSYHAASAALAHGRALSFLAAKLF
ncbi:MAG: dienelactone hydrolase family protein [Burkholderiales bacterium]|nr:dienelactone hydrolase family protein [Burkholderiales bacterium]